MQVRVSCCCASAAATRGGHEARNIAHVELVVAVERQIVANVVLHDDAEVGRRMASRDINKQVWWG